MGDEEVQAIVVDDMATKAPKFDGTREFWMVCSVMNDNIDEIAQSFGVEVYIKVYWHRSHGKEISAAEEQKVTHDGGEEMTVATAAAKYKFNVDGNLNKGWELVNDGCMPFNPKSPFGNSLGPADVTCDWVAYHSDYQLFSAQVHWIGTLRCMLDTRRFPFDRHLLCMVVNTCQGWHNNEKYKWKLSGRTRPLGLRGRPDADHPDGFFPFPPANLKTTEMYERGGVTKAAAESMCLKADCEGEVDKPVARMWADKAPRGFKWSEDGEGGEVPSTQKLAIYREDGCAFSENKKRLDTNGHWMHESPYIDMPGEVQLVCLDSDGREMYEIKDGKRVKRVHNEKALMLCIRIVRRPYYFVTNIVLAIFMIVSCTNGMEWAFEEIDVGDRLTLVLASLLTVVAFKFATNEQLPTKASLCTAEKYFLWVFAYHVIFAMRVVAPSIFDLRSAISDSPATNTTANTVANTTSSPSAATDWGKVGNVINDSVLMLTWVLGHLFGVLFPRQMFGVRSVWDETKLGTAAWDHIWTQQLQSNRRLLIDDFADASIVVPSHERRA